MKTIELKKSQRIHFIAIGGAVMHNMALAMHNMGHHVTGSDDAIFEPSKSRLEKAGLLPENGWHLTRITDDIDLIILGMHARKDNPELQKAIELGIPIVSFPEFVGLLSKDKTRVSIAGSHGKTTTTSMVMHALKDHGIAHDYLLGAQLKGYDTMVQVSDAPLIVIESDEYLSSCLDPRPKMLHYDPHYVVLTGIEWDHVNVFPTEESYHQAFRDFLQQLSDGAAVFYDKRDATLDAMCREAGVQTTGYVPFESSYENGLSLIQHKGKSYPVKLFGQHNFANMRAAALICEKLGLPVADFLQSMAHFEGAQRRMQILHDQPELTVIQDFAHAPSKVKATVDGVREKYPAHHITAVLELHTFSSLNPEYIAHYRNGLQAADKAVVLYLPASSDHKKLDRLDSADILAAFDKPGLQIANSGEELRGMLLNNRHTPEIMLLMSSGFWGGMDVVALINELRADA
jgi:UDP-N-acetylmuramate: L-alanyl-gamma-D-glutamyl-meso-diaminopimelate ligase